MKVLKRNQLILLVIGLMLVTAGYLNYTTDPNKAIDTSGIIEENSYAGIGDATLVNGGALVENDEIVEENTREEGKTQESNKTEEASSITNGSEENNSEEEKSASMETASQNANDYYTESKLQRDTMYSQMLASYQKMLDSTSISEEQKAIAQTEIKKINDAKNAIMIAENLITTKGFKNVVIFINDESVSVVVQEENLSKEQVAQIQNIISREMKAEIEDIHISSK